MQAEGSVGRRAGFVAALGTADLVEDVRTGVPVHTRFA